MPQAAPSVTRSPTQAKRPKSPAARRFARLTGGGTAGNEQLTSIVGVILIILLAVVGVTIVRIGQLMWTHLFVGLLVLGPVALKLASTGYRFIRYYTRDRVYVEKGPPPPALRLIAPAVVVTTIAIFVSGIVLLFEGPAHRGQLVLIHKASFIVWLVFTALHVLGHLPQLPDGLRAPSLSGQRAATREANGALGRWIAITGALVGGAVLAIVLIPHFGAWTAPGAIHHHHH